jgi:hypothetical protein
VCGAFVVSTGRRRKNDAPGSCRRRLNFKLRSHRIILFYFYYFILFYFSFIGNTEKQVAFVEALKVGGGINLFRNTAAHFTHTVTRNLFLLRREFHIVGGSFSGVSHVEVRC